MSESFIFYLGGDGLTGLILAGSSREDRLQKDPGLKNVTIFHFPYAAERLCVGISIE